MAYGAIYKHENVDLVAYYEHSDTMYLDLECVLAGMPVAEKRRDTLVMPFQNTIWVMILITLIASAALLYFYVEFFKEMSVYSFGEWAMHIWATFFQEPHSSLSFLKSIPLRAFFMIFTAMSFVLASSYSGILVSYLTTPPRLLILNTLQDMADSKLDVLQVYDFTDFPQFYPGIQYRLDVIAR